jgi:hypothetical protein
MRMQTRPLRERRRGVHDRRPWAGSRYSHGYRKRNGPHDESSGGSRADCPALASAPSIMGPPQSGQTPRSIPVSLWKRSRQSSSAISCASGAAGWGALSPGSRAWNGGQDPLESLRTTALTNGIARRLTSHSAKVTPVHSSLLLHSRSARSGSMAHGRTPLGAGESAGTVSAMSTSSQ